MVDLPIATYPDAGGCGADSEHAGDAQAERICVVSYSLTGNNGALAEAVAQELDAHHVRITEPKRRAMAKIVLDLMTDRTPSVEFDLKQAEHCDLLIFVGPVWMGKVASPFRACFEKLRPRIKTYAFVSVCGGADGPNPGLRNELEERLGHAPVKVEELHIADLLPAEPEPQRKDTMKYRLTEADVMRLTNTVAESAAAHMTQGSGK